MDINSNEKFIEHNIAELALNYDSIRGMNVNLARIAPDLCDGLKIVQRRSLYSMYLDGCAKEFKKLATIGGNIFGRFHPHCLHGSTEFLLTNGTKLSIEDMYKSNKDNYEIISFNPYSKGLSINTIHNIQITKYCDEIYEINFTNGAKLLCTDDHKILTIDSTDNSINWKMAKDLKVDDLLYSEKISNLSFKNKNIEYQDISYSDIYVKSINILKFDNSIPMYDFTSTNISMPNAAILSGKDNIIIVHNSTTAITDAIVLMAQSWRNMIPLVEPSGNFGDSSGSPAGAPRYIKAKLSDYAISCFFDDWKDSVVDMKEAYIEGTYEPVFLPSKYPNILLNGTLGIGFGMSSNLPAYNFKEVVEATIKLIHNPNSNIVLIPDSTTGADIIQTDFASICDRGRGVYNQRCTYEIDPESNTIRITSLPELITASDITDKIATLKLENKFSELQHMEDLSGKTINIILYIREDINPYKFVRKLISEVPGLERSYPVNITVVNDYCSYDLSIKDLLLEWIKYRREQKRVVISNKRTNLVSEQRTNDVKIFILSGNNLQDTVKIFSTNKNRESIEKELIRRYKDTPIHLDSLQARALSNMKMVELSTDARDSYLKLRDQLIVELDKLENILNKANGIDEVIVGELQEGIKRFGCSRRSNIVPKKINVSSEVEGHCILTLTSDGIINRRQSSNIEEPIPPLGGFACNVDNGSSFILINDLGYNSFIRVKDIPLDTDVPVARYSKKPLAGNIVALVPCNIDEDESCTLISRKGIIKRIRTIDMRPSNKPFISLDANDSLIRGIVTKTNSNKEILIYTRNGLGQKISIHSIKPTQLNAKGSNGIKVDIDDELEGCFLINPTESAYLLYVTLRGKCRLNDINYFPTRINKHDSFVNLISLSDRDKLVSVIAVNKYDKVKIFYGDGTDEELNIDSLEETTMGDSPKKVLKKSITSKSDGVVKVKII